MGAIPMSSSSDLEARKREISVLVDEVNAAERALHLPEVEGLDDPDRMEAMDILNRIERRMLAKEAAE
jgi:hypothetical protein